MLQAKFCDSKVIDGRKAFVEQWGQSTGVTLRAIIPHQGTKRMVISDLYFGSINTVLALKLHGLQCVVKVKAGLY